MDSTIDEYIFDGTDKLIKGVNQHAKVTHFGGL